MAITAKMAARVAGMKSMSAKDAKNAFGLLLDTARAEPVTIEKHGRRVVVVVSVEEYERLTGKRPKSPGGAKSVAAEKGKGG
jgi:prevent-host-death family protein